jgi:DnaJ family protein A protein 2
MKVGLEEMYKGSVRKLQMTRSVKCNKCSGSGSKSGKRYTCEVRYSLAQCWRAWLQGVGLA